MNPLPFNTNIMECTDVHAQASGDIELSSNFVVFTLRQNVHCAVTVPIQYDGPSSIFRILASRSDTLLSSS